MKCSLCQKIINNYNIEFNHLAIDKTYSVDICSNCISKFMHWQQTKIAKLFPTKIMKKLTHNKS